ncbi:hypothetical protein MLD38_002033 [Melastoma candidum]|uniref:Uncharacterized protein n=1 Tax=Melastoma candidum TaxID=119954 RepID=A0ACB9SFK9_9MYRT|nr:hypothetical protein MLD38_002033 [Melastoma candidum]
MAVAVPISCEAAHTGMPMRVSDGDETKLFAYSVQEFTKFSPHDICPLPQETVHSIGAHKCFQPKFFPSCPDSYIVGYSFIVD